jgi:hypothetical protein
MARDLRQGIEPPMLRTPQAFRAIPQDVVTDRQSLADVWDPYWATFKAEAGIEVTA